MKVNKWILGIATLLGASLTALAQTEIRTAADMAAIGKDKNSIKGEYVLMNDITLADWSPIGFGGRFNGNGHTITLTVNTTDEAKKMKAMTTFSQAGLFSGIGAGGVVMNLRVAGEINCASNYVLLAAGGIAGVNKGLIVNCYASGSVEAAGDGRKFAGGIAGGNGSDYIMRTTTTTSASAGQVSAGMSMSSVSAVEGAIVNCYAAGVVSVHDDDGSRIAGGVAGRNVNLLENCVALNSRIDVAGVSKKSGVLSNNPNVTAAGGLLGENYSDNLTRGADAKNGYYRADIVMSVQRDESYKDDEPLGVGVEPSAAQRQEWWTESPKFAFGQTNDAPWTWDDALQRPALYWEKSPAAPMPPPPLTKAERKTAAESATEGELSPSMAWRIENETLFVTGEGTLPVPTSTAMPWPKTMFSAVVVEDGIASIGHHAFANSKNIVSVALGADVVEVGTYAFFNCDNLAVMEVYSATPPKVRNFAFLTTPIGKARLIVPHGAKAAYEKSRSWKAFGTIEETTGN